MNDVDVITLGCSKNLVDTERVMGMLSNVGFKCHHNPKRITAPIAIINTCGFIGDAKEESINTILKMAACKKIQHLYVMGCLSQRYREELSHEIPEVEAWFGKFEWDKVVATIASLTSPTPTTKHGCIMRQLTTPKHYAYVKISEGCNRMCSYCAIPLITGRHTSRPIEDILEEMRWLVKQGVKEFNIIAQDLSSYGLDTEQRHLLPSLIEQMAQIEGVQWIRLHYAYPTDFPWELLPIMANNANICKYLDIALQHSSDHMLQRMRRHITCAEQEAVIARIRNEVPGICIRTTLLVGHPGETKEDFEHLKAWVQKMRFDRMGAFAYSDEDGTYAHTHYQDDVPPEIKQARLDELMDIQQCISAELLQKRVGQTLKVIIDRLDGEYYVGRTEYDSPDVDCEVLISPCEGIKIGEFYNVKITKAEEFDLYGIIC